MIGRCFFDVGKQIAPLRERLEQFAQFAADGETRRFTILAEFFATVNEHATLPVNIFGGEIGGVGLSRAGFVKHFVISPALGVALTRDDRGVFVG